VVEAMASGTPVVFTSIGCQGLGVIDGRHLLVADNETDFSRQVMGLLRDPERSHALAAAARALAAEKYSWGRLISDMEPKLEGLVNKMRSGSSRIGGH
jgi:glycosyltransferase involved in cell wall biosynthesis